MRRPTIAAIAIAALALAGCSETTPKKPEQSKPVAAKKKRPVFDGTSASARSVVRHAYGSGTDNKTRDGKHKRVRYGHCVNGECVLQVSPNEPVFSTERELLEGTRPAMKALFRRKSTRKVRLVLYGTTTTIGGKEGYDPVARLTCDREAARQINWDNVDEDGLKALCDWVPLVKLG